MKLLVIGGARFSGRAFTGLALDAGHDVTIFHRGGGPEDPWPAAEHVHGDRHEGFGSLKGRSFDVVVDTCAFVPRDLEEAADAFADTGLYLFVSSLSAHTDVVREGATEDDDVYQPPFPDTEDVTNETYGPLKVASERALRARFGERALVVRPGYIVGPYDPTDRFTYWVRRAARGGEMLAPGPPDAVMQWVDARDLAAFMLALCEQRTGGTFNVVTPPGRHSIGELLELSRAEAGADTRAHVDRRTVRAGAGPARRRRRGRCRCGRRGCPASSCSTPLGRSARGSCAARSCRPSATPCAGIPSAARRGRCRRASATSASASCSPHGTPRHRRRPAAREEHRGPRPAVLPRLRRRARPVRRVDPALPPARHGRARRRRGPRGDVPERLRRDRHAHGRGGHGPRGPGEHEPHRRRRRRSGVAPVRGRVLRSRLSRSTCSNTSTARST